MPNKKQQTHTALHRRIRPANRLSRLSKQAAAFAMAVALLGGAPADSAAQDPGWVVNPAAFQHSMNVTSAVYVDGVAVAGTDYALAAFVGETLRGVTQPTIVNGKSVFFLTVYANTNGESTTFRLYDAAADSVRRSMQSLSFQTNGVLGTPSQPVRVYFGEGTPSDDPEAWVVDPSVFSLTMTATLRVGIGGGEALVDDQAVMAAFVGSDVRGKATATTVTGGASGTRTLFFLTLYANAEGEQITIRVASPAQDSVYTFPAAITFAANTVLGSPDDPITAGSMVTTGEDPSNRDGDRDDDYDSFGMDVFPNPAVDVLHVTWEASVSAKVSVRVYDIRGRLVDDLGEHTADGGRAAVDVWLGSRLARAYPPGVYFVTLREGNRVGTRAFVVPG